VGINPDSLFVIIYKGITIMNRPSRYVLLVMIIYQLTGIAQPEQSLSTSNGTDNPFSQSKFVPDISFILDATYLRRDIKDDDFNAYEVPGFLHSPNEVGVGDELNSRNGFNLNYGELAITSTVDPYFDVTGIFHIRPDGLEMEEGFFITRNIPYGFQIKGGKFLSGFGRINEQHAHYWNFASIPLVYKAFFGSEGLNEIGAQVSWVAPIDQYLMFGGEILQGENENSFGVNGFNDPLNVSNIASSNGPNLAICFVRTSFDLGDIVCLAGISGAFGKHRLNNGFDANNHSGYASYGNTRIVGGNVNIKYLLSSDQDITFQTEYLYRTMTGDLFYRGDDTTVVRNILDQKQSGLYSQLVFKYSTNWKIGIRYDALVKNDIEHNSIKQDNPTSFPQITGMLEYNPTEFSRLRLEYIYDRSKYLEIEEGYSQKTSSTILFELNLVIGAHGAHSF
jgi:hypothetical protein